MRCDVAWWEWMSPPLCELSIKKYRVELHPRASPNIELFRRTCIEYRNRTRLSFFLTLFCFGRLPAVIFYQRSRVCTNIPGTPLYLACPSFSFYFVFAGDRCGPCSFLPSLPLCPGVLTYLCRLRLCFGCRWFTQGA